MLSLFSKQDIIKAYLDKKHADFDKKLDKIIMTDESESVHDKKIRELVQKDFAEEFETVGLTVDDYFDAIDSKNIQSNENRRAQAQDEHLLELLANLGISIDAYLEDELAVDDYTVEDYPPLDFLKEEIERFPRGSDNMSREEYEKIIPTNIFYDRFCSNFEADFDKGNMHGLGVKLDIDELIPTYDFDSTACADENIENVVKYNTKSLNEVMRKLGHKEFPETAKVETKVNIRCFDDLDTGDIVLDDLGADVANSGEQSFEDAGNSKVKVKTRLHGASYQSGFVYDDDFKERMTLIYFDAEFESTLELDQKIIDEILEMQDVSMSDFERRAR